MTGKYTVAMTLGIERHYANQSGDGIPVFVGQRYQRGHGLGQTISGLFKRYVIPFVTPRAKEVGKKIMGNVVKTGMEVAGDVSFGQGGKRNLDRTRPSRYKENARRHHASVADCQR